MNVEYESAEYASFKSTFWDVLNKYAPLKKKAVRADHATFIVKAFMRAIMKQP